MKCMVAVELSGCAAPCLWLSDPHLERSKIAGGFRVRVA